MESQPNAPLFGPGNAAVERWFSGPRRFWIAAFLAIALVGGGCLRFLNLGKYGFWTDEYFHVFAAQSYNRDHKLTVPLHGEYTRAFPITWITAQSFRLFGVSETSARAPFAAVNLLFLLVGFAFVRRIYGLLPALAMTGVLAFAPFSIHMSRECRMYTVFQLLYFSWTLMFLIGLEPLRPRKGWEGRLGIDLRWLIGSGVVFVASVPIQTLTVNGGLVVAAYLAGMFAWEAVTRGPRAAVWSKYGLGVALMAAVGAVAIALGRDALSDLLGKAQDVPDWAMAGRADTSFYRYLLSDAYPFFFFAFPLAAVAFMREHGRRGFFAVLSFVLLFILHSYVFGRKGDRYIFYIFPFFILVSSSLAAEISLVVAARLRDSLAGANRWTKAAGYGAAVLSFYVFCYPWLLNGIRLPFTYNEVDWKAAQAELAERTKGHETVNTSPMPYIYYFGHQPEYFFLGEWWKEWPYGEHLVRNVGDLERIFDRPGEVIIVTDQGRIGNTAFLNKDMVNLITARTRMETSKVDPRIRYYEEIPAKKP